MEGGGGGRVRTFGRNSKTGVRKRRVANRRMPVIMPESCVCAPTWLLTAEREKEPVTG